MFGVLALAACGVSSQAPADKGFAAKARALDGDTVAVDFRLLGVDAFERRQLCERSDGCWPCGKAAQDFAAKALRASAAEIKLVGPSTYGRPVATVTVDGDDLGEQLIRAGLAVPEPHYLGGDPKRAQLYAAALARAKAARAGAFDGRWLEPSRWRRGDRLQCEQ